MKKSVLGFSRFRWILPVAVVSVMAIGCGSSETPAEEPAATEEVAPAPAASTTDTTTTGPDTSNMPVDTGAGGKPPVNRK